MTAVQPTLAARLAQFVARWAPILRNRQALAMLLMMGATIIGLDANEALVGEWADRISIIAGALGLYAWRPEPAPPLVEHGPGARSGF